MSKIEDAELSMSIVEKLIGKYDCFRGEYGVMCLGDSRILIREIPDSTIDCVITDPPWGTIGDKYDDPEILFELENEMYRVLKNNSWLVFYYTPKNVLDLARFKRFKYTWMMPYIFWSFSTYSRNPMGTQSSYSIIVVMRKGEPRVYLQRRDVILSDEIPVVEEKIREPVFKPTYTSLVLLSMFTKRGDTVLDPFSGYGGIPLVCELFGRKWIAFEIDPVKYNIAREIVSKKTIPDISRIKEKYRRERKRRITDWLEP